MSFFVDADALNQFAAVWGDVMLSATLRGSLLLALFALIASALRRRTASSRHLVWTMGVVALLALPLLTAVLPPLEAPVPARWSPAAWVPELSDPEPGRPQLRLVSRPEGQEPARTAGPRYQPASFPIPTGELRSAVLHPGEEMAAPAIPSMRTQLLATLSGLGAAAWLLLLWETGLLLVASFFLMGGLRVWWLARHSGRLEHPRWNTLLDELVARLDIRHPVELRMSRGRVTPMTWGIRRSIVLLPSDASTWSEDVRHDVLLHELTHVRRRDALTQFLAQLTCAIHWFNPLVWIALGQMRVERERACDDQVLMAGSKASSYASHLLEMARSLKSENATSFATLAMARRSQLSDRLVAVLDPKLRRGAPGRVRGTVLALLGGLVILPLAAVAPTFRDADAHPTPRAAVARTAGHSSEAVPAPPAPAMVFPGRRDHAIRHEGVHDPASCVFATPGETYVEVSRNRVWSPSRSSEECTEVPSVAIAPEPAPALGVVFLPDALDRRTDGRGEPTRSLGVAEAPPVHSHHGSVFVVPPVEAPAVAITPGGDPIRVAPPAVAVAVGLGDRIRGALSDRFNGRSNWTYSDDGYKLRVEMEGEIEFAEDESHVVAMSDDAYFELEERIDRDRRRVEIESEDGEVVTTFYEGRRRVEDDEESRAWLAEVLPQALRNMGIGVDKRVQRIYGNGGVDALINEMDELRSDHLLALYTREFLALESASAEDQKKVLGVFLDEMDSDYETANLMIEAMPLLMSDPALREEFVDLLDDIDSDYECRRVLSTAMNEHDFDTPEMIALVEAAQDISSDYELAEFLGSIDTRHLNDAAFRLAYFDAVETLDSDFERSRVLKIVLDHGGSDEQTLEFVLRSIQDIDSNYECANILVETAEMFVVEGDHLESYFDAVEDIDSDYERGRVLRALMAHRNLPEVAQLRVVESIDDMSSDFERVNLIIELAAMDEHPPAVHEALMRVVDEIDSDHEYGRAMKAIRRAERRSRGNSGR